MSFVCEHCADGLSSDEIDMDATYPDSELGGTDTKTGGHICKGCAKGEMPDTAEACLDRMQQIEHEIGNLRQRELSLLNEFRRLRKHYQYIPLERL